MTIYSFVPGLFVFQVIEIVAALYMFHRGHILIAIGCLSAAVVATIIVNGAFTSDPYITEQSEIYQKQEPLIIESQRLAWEKMMLSQEQIRAGTHPVMVRERENDRRLKELESQIEIHVPIGQENRVYYRWKSRK